mmetsp:Transcript_45621/g.111100  ORF Transcript_45621/g.111100 Transcript_45621/m.111100 type:complete len:260 (-) Transcript_45621:1099-1878(-)
MFRFVHLVSGPKDTNKYTAINAAMLCFSHCLRMKGYEDKPDDPKGYYQPSATAKFIGNIFTVLHHNNCQYDHGSFKNQPGSYWNYFSIRFAMVATVRPEFGRRKVAAVDHDNERKMRQASKPFNFDDYTDLLYVLMWKVAREFTRRGGKEIVELKMTDFRHYRISRGPLSGRMCWGLEGTTDDKMRRLGLGGGELNVRDDQFYHIAVDDPNDPEWCLYRLFNKFVTEHLPPGYTEQIFLRQAPEKVLVERRKKGDTTQA